MKKMIILMLTPLPFMFFTLRNDSEKAPILEETTFSKVHEEVSPSPPPIVDEASKKAATASYPSNTAATKPSVSTIPTALDKEARLEMIAYALTLLGTPYVYGGSNTQGFDCSGFTTHVFDTFGVNVGRSSALQASDGIQIDRKDAREGDLLIFTGTNLSVREPGHAGIIISPPGDTISFVHSSSVGGVKISKVEGTRYNDRLLQIRRVL